MANRFIKQYIKNILTSYEIKIRNKTRCEDLQQESGIIISCILILSITALIIFKELSQFNINSIIGVLSGGLIANSILLICNYYQSKKHKSTIELADKVLEDELAELEKELEKNEHR